MHSNLRASLKSSCIDPSLPWGKMEGLAGRGWELWEGMGSFSWEGFVGDRVLWKVGRNKETKLWEKVQFFS